MLRLKKAPRVVVGAIVAATIGCDDPTAPRQALPSQAALTASSAATMTADASHAQLVALVQDALERLSPALARPDRDRVVAPLNALAEKLSVRDADGARQQLVATERALDAAASATSVDPDVESLRLQLAALRSAFVESSTSF